MDTTSNLSSRKKTINFSSVRSVYRTLSPEKVLIVWLLIFISLVLIFAGVAVFNLRFLTTVPTYGGQISEGIIGTPRFINPVLAVTDQDKDMTSLVYAGLTKKDSSGKSVLDMADIISTSEDSLKYTVSIKTSAKFHDGSPVTADDIIYTISLIQNPNIKSPHRVEWEGVTLEKINSTTLVFSLKKPYPFFMDNLSIGILQKNLWKDLTDEQISLSDLNINAVGSGPYKIKLIKRDSGIPVSFTLTAHKDYTLGRPYLETMTIDTYQNEKFLLQALANGDISRAHGIAPPKVVTLNIATSSIRKMPLPRTFTVFFNPNKAQFLSEKNVRLALEASIDKEKILKDVLLGYGKIVDGPYPFDDAPYENSYNPTLAKELLEKSSTYKKAENASSSITLTIATANTDEMRQIAEQIQRDWEALGIKTSLLIYEVPDLNQTIIKNRDFEVLLFGSITQNPSDLYAFWHSSQRTYPGLNISNYVSKQLDANLEILRESGDELARISAYDAVKKEFKEEVPGIFLFAPSLIYVTNDKVRTQLPESSADSSSRFSLIPTWYRYTEKVWLSTYSKKSIEILQNIIH